MRCRLRANWGTPFGIRSFRDSSKSSESASKAEVKSSRRQTEGRYSGGERANCRQPCAESRPPALPRRLFSRALQLFSVSSFLPEIAASRRDVASAADIDLDWMPARGRDADGGVAKHVTATVSREHIGKGGGKA